MTIVTPSMVQLVDRMKRHAETGLYRGRTQELDLPYFAHARQLHEKTGTSLIFTRDTGHHTSGWFKNPDYERCYHLSVSFHVFNDDGGWQPAEYDTSTAKAWALLFYGNDVRFIWDESNKTHHQLEEVDWQDVVMKDTTKQMEIHHYRVFCDPRWKPIIPRGEVYTRDFIEKGWLSWSDLQAEKQEAVK